MVSSNTEQRDHQGPLGPLSGLRVLELATLIAGPFAGRYLADFGAEVIKIEQPGTGDPLRYWGKRADGGESLWHLVQSRGKLSVTADLHDTRDQALVRRTCNAERRAAGELSTRSAGGVESRSHTNSWPPTRG